VSDALAFAAILLAAVGLGMERYVSDRTSKSDPLIRPTRQGLRAGMPFRGSRSRGHRRLALAHMIRTSVLLPTAATLARNCRAMNGPRTSRAARTRTLALRLSAQIDARRNWSKLDDVTAARCSPHRALLHRTRGGSEGGRFLIGWAYSIHRCCHGFGMCKGNHMGCVVNVGKASVRNPPQGG
jgi:hypothetical protein